MDFFFPEGFDIVSGYGLLFQKLLSVMKVQCLRREADEDATYITQRWNWLKRTITSVLFLSSFCSGGFEILFWEVRKKKS